MAKGVSANSRAREIVKDAFKDITDVSCISLHSLRVSGATAAANAGFLRDGGWQSENAKNEYVKDMQFSIVTFSLEIIRNLITPSRVLSIGLEFFLCVTATSAVRFFHPIDARWYFPE